MSGWRGRAAKILSNSEWREEGAWINTGEGVGTTFGFREEEKEEEEETDPPLFFGAENSGQVLLGKKSGFADFGPKSDV